jgi:hypothetical protein
VLQNVGEKAGLTTLNEPSHSF